jgi:mono/diheme cytochrome c family protein
MSRLLNVGLFLILLAVLGLNWTIRRDPAQRNYEVLADMVTTPAYKSQAVIAAVSGGNTALRPVAGTIARDLLPLHYGNTPEEAKRAGAELANPVDLNDRQAVERGAMVFGNFCAVCHGPNGQGDGTITTRGFPPPPSLYAENATSMADGQMFHVVTYGQKNMPGYASQVPRPDRWKAIAYIRSLQKKRKEAAQRAAALPPASASRVTQEVKP